MYELKPISNLQTLNLALATGFVVTCGDAVQALVFPGEEKVIPESYVLLALIVFIGTKVAFDDHVGLEKGKIRPFMFLDGLFLIVSYALIISASAVVVKFHLATGLLAAYLLCLFLWNFVMLAVPCAGPGRRRSRMLYEQAKWLGKVPLWFRCLYSETSGPMVGIWAALDYAFAVVLAVLAMSGEAPALILVTLTLFLVLDLFSSGSFGK